MAGGIFVDPDHLSRLAGGLEASGRSLAQAGALPAPDLGPSTPAALSVLAEVMRTSAGMSADTGKIADDLHRNKGTYAQTEIDNTAMFTKRQA